MVKAILSRPTIAIADLLEQQQQQQHCLAFDEASRTTRLATAQAGVGVTSSSAPRIVQRRVPWLPLGDSEGLAA